jgi:RNA polymerase sigma factor (sigma-70 family)
LGYGNDIDDAVQDAALIALHRVRDIRDPAAVGPWLYAVVRNVCRSRLRERTAIPLDDMDAVCPPMDSLDPERLLEGHAMRDWVWRAIEDLPAEQRLITMLRYFTDVTSYEHIAQVCGIPAGTVGSRLNRARVNLHEALIAAETLAHTDVAALHRTRLGEAADILRYAEQGQFARVGVEQFDPSVEAVWPQGHTSKGFDLLAAAMNRDLDAGVRQRLTGVVASHDITIWEADLISPPDDPQHCPPAVVWVQFLRNGRAQRVRLFHAPRVADH